MMAIVMNGQVARVKIPSSKAGAEVFKANVRRIFHLPDSVDLDLDFEFKAPGAGGLRAAGGYKVADQS